MNLAKLMMVEAGSSLMLAIQIVKKASDLFDQIAHWIVDDLGEPLLSTRKEYVEEVVKLVLQLKDGNFSCQIKLRQLQLSGYGAYIWVNGGRKF
jgi:hypothetical protein